MTDGPYCILGVMVMAGPEHDQRCPVKRSLRFRLRGLRIEAAWRLRVLFTGDCGCDPW